MDWHGQTSTPGDRRWQTLLLVLSLLLLMCCPAAAQEADVSTVAAPTRQAISIRPM